MNVKGVGPSGKETKDPTENRKSRVTSTLPKNMVCTPRRNMGHSDQINEGTTIHPKERIEDNLGNSTTQRQQMTKERVGPEITGTSVVDTEYLEYKGLLVSRTVGHPTHYL